VRWFCVKGEKKMSKAISNSVEVVILAGVLAICVPSLAHARAVQEENLRTLILESDAIMVGRIESISETSIEHQLGYPTLAKSHFVEMCATVRVTTAIKNVTTNSAVLLHFLKLKDGERGPLNAPQLLDLNVGPQLYLMFLKRPQDEPKAEYYWAFTDPMDPINSVIWLDRKNPKVAELKARYDDTKRRLAEALKVDASDSSLPDEAATLWMNGELWRELDAMLTFPDYLKNIPEYWADIADYEIKRTGRIVPFKKSNQVQNKVPENTGTNAPTSQH
jgi:hypothetical protein